MTQLVHWLATSGNWITTSTRIKWIVKRGISNCEVWRQCYFTYIAISHVKMLLQISPQTCTQWLCSFQDHFCMQNWNVAVSSLWVVAIFVNNNWMHKYPRNALILNNIHCTIPRCNAALKRTFIVFPPPPLHRHYALTYIPISHANTLLKGTKPPSSQTLRTESIPDLKLLW